MGCFCSSCVYLVHFLHKSTEFHVKQKRCVKKLSFIYHLFFSRNSCHCCGSAAFHRLLFKRMNAPESPNLLPSTNIFLISASLQIKWEGDLLIEERGGMMMMMMMIMMMESGDMVT